MQEIGIVHSNGVDAFYSLNPLFDYSILCSEGTMGVKSPATVVQELEDRFYTNMTKRTVVVVEGSYEWLRMYHGTVDNADVMVYLGSAEDLHKLKIKPLDEHWEPGDAPLVLQEFVASRLAAMDEGMVPVDEPVLPVPDDHPIETGTPTESSADEFGFAQDPLDQPVKSAPLDLLGEMTQQRISRKLTAQKILALVHWAFADEATPAEIAAALWLEASDARTTVEADIRAAVTEEGGEMRGLEWAVKSQDSIERKLRDKYQPRGLMGDDLAQALQDVLRFTAVFHPADYANSVQRTLWHLQAYGYQVMGEDNSWAPGDIYDALHYVLSPPMASVPVELQFHTEETWTLKEVKQHQLYEELRDPSTPPERQAELWDTMASYWADIERPLNADQFPGLRLYPRPARREASFRDRCACCVARKEAYLSEEGFKSKKQWRMCFSGAWDGVDQDQCKQYAELVDWDSLPEYVEGD